MQRLYFFWLLFVSAGLPAQDLLIGSRLGNASRHGLSQELEPLVGGGVIRLLPRLDRLAMLTCQETERLLVTQPGEASFAVEALSTHVLALRHLQLPDSERDGARLARRIRTHCRSDPQQLLLAAVDLSLREQLLPWPPYANRTTPPPRGTTSVDGIPVY